MVLLEPGIPAAVQVLHAPCHGGLGAASDGTLAGADREVEPVEDLAVALAAAAQGPADHEDDDEEHDEGAHTAGNTDESCLGQAGDGVLAAAAVVGHGSQGAR